MTVTIYHDPDCGTSRNTLAMIRQSGIEPPIVEYIRTPSSREILKSLIATMEISVRALRREGHALQELGLTIPGRATTSCWISCWRIPS